MFDLGVHFGHNATFTLAKDGQIIEVLEMERLVNLKNAGLTWYIPVSKPLEILNSVANRFRTLYGFNGADRITMCNGNSREVLGVDIRRIFGGEFYTRPHQECHAASSLWQSPHDQCIVISSDGGGDDGCFAIFHASKANGIERIANIPDYNLAMKYAHIGKYAMSIRREASSLLGNLVYPGKLMGLAAYGKIIPEWVNPIRDFYFGHHSWENGDCWAKQERHMDKVLWPYLNKDEILKSGGADLAATNQFVFEQLFYDLTSPIVKQAPNLPVHITGGCALNILNNTSLSQIWDIFVTHNPSDCGIATGSLLSYLRKDHDVTYAGPEVFDKEMISQHVHERSMSEYNSEVVARALNEGAIVGMVHGRAEHGPRALGNRSILCNPMISDMKNILNAKVKNREYYRPFAPVVRLEDVSKYFEFDGESRWMTFSPRVRDKYRTRLSSITHADGTARIQTVTEQQNPRLYDLLTQFEKVSGEGCLINTSFNLAGKPILNTYADALKVFDLTQMDALVLDNYYVRK